MHFYVDDLDIVIFSLIKKNISFYNNFIKMFFNIDLSEESDLLLLPIAFKKFISPVEFLSNNSTIEHLNEPIKEFIKLITLSSKNLLSEGIEESVLVDYTLYLEGVKNINNSDLVVKIDPSAKLAVNIIKKLDVGVLTNDPMAKEVFSRSFSVPPSNDIEDISSWIALYERDNLFLPREEKLWDKYLIRKKLNLTKKQIMRLVYFSVMQKVAVFYWLSRLEIDEIYNTLETCINNPSFDRFIAYYCEDILINFSDKTAHSLLKKLELKGIKIDKTINDNSNILSTLRKEYGTNNSNPELINKLESKLDEMIKLLIKGGGGIESQEARRYDNLIFKLSILK